MPELPEVESMRQTLLALRRGYKEAEHHETQTLKIERVKDNPPKVFPSDKELKLLSGNCSVVDVIRKGKLLCMILDCTKPILLEEGQKSNNKRVYLYLHMGMTGRISSPTLIPHLTSLKETAKYPPPHTYLIFSLIDTSQSDKVVAEASFSDPRKFGSVQLSLQQDRLQELAQDALCMPNDKVKEAILGFTEQSTPIKSILLDQKRVVSGVGNWVADEVLYRCQLHPDQNFLSRDEAQRLVEKLSEILHTAVDCLCNKNQSFPEEWLFSYRWAKKRKGVKDAKGRTIAFVKSGGRTSAIVPLIQKKRARSAMKQKLSVGDEDSSSPKTTRPTRKRKTRSAS